MLKLLFLVICVLFASAAQASPSETFIVDGNGLVDIQRFSSPVCDSNNHTPDESLKCKIEFWEDTVRRYKTILEADQKRLTEAQDRLNAFKDIQKRK